MVSVSFWPNIAFDARDIPPRFRAASIKKPQLSLASNLELFRTRDDTTRNNRVND
jgi:hypothetical protein